jgi:hypothetical protein
MDEVETGEFNLDAAAEEIIAESDSTPEATEESSQSEGQTEQVPQESVEAKEPSPEDILNQLSQEKESPEQFAEILKAVNALGAVHHGAPITVDSPEKLKQLLEMGAGFYQKTEAHANEVKAKEAEFQQKDAHFKEVEGKLAQKEQEIEQVVYTNQILGSIVQDLQVKDPELFAHLDALYREKENSYQSQMPFKKQFEGKISELENKLKGFESQKQGEELGKIKQSWEAGLSEVQTKFAAPLQKLGIKGDWSKVKEVWSADATGTMTPEQAFFAVHGKDIVKANESHKKLLETKAKTQAKLLGRTGIGSGQRGKEETIEAQAGDYDSILRIASATM